MKVRNIPRTFAVAKDLGFKNLIVGGCSFTYNNSDEHCVTWPYYLRDIGGFEQVYDFSMVGGGNAHTARALIYGIEKNPEIINNSLIIVQIAGFDRDDYIVDPTQLNDYPFKYFYENNAVVGITGGEKISNLRNSGPIVELKEYKSLQARAIENFVNIKSLESYFITLKNKFMFFEYRDYSLPGRDTNFDIRLHLPKLMAKKYNSIVTPQPKNFYKFCVKNDLLSEDDFHPSSTGHLEWTRQVLMPYLIDRVQYL